MVGFPLLLAAASLSSIFLMRRGHLTLGSGLVFSLNLILPLLVVVIIQDTLWTALLYAVISSALLIWRALPQRSWVWSAIITVATLILVAVLDVISPVGRFRNPPAFNVFMVLVILVLFLAFVTQFVRQTWGRSIRNKLLVALIGVTLFGAGTLAIYGVISTTRTLQRGLELQLAEHTSEAANGIGALLDEQVDLTHALSLNEMLENTVKEINQTYQGDAKTIQALMERRDTEWRAADASNNNSDPLVQEYLTNEAALELKEFQKQFPDHVELFVTDIYGGQAGSTDRTSDYYQADEAWWQAAYNKGQGAVYISEPEYDQSAGAVAILIAMPLRADETGKIIGILRTTYLASGFDQILGEVVDATGTTSLLFPGEPPSFFQGEEFKPAQPELFKQLQAVRDQSMVTMDFGDVPSVVLQSPVQSLEDDSMVNDLGWKVVYHQDQAEALTPINADVRGSIFVMVVVIIFAVTAALILSLYLVRPIAELTQTAEEVASGNLNSRSKVTSTDEVGVLASTFNSMTSQLQETLQGLEQRFAARTRDLAIVAEVGTATATILESKRLLQEVVDLTKERFHLYHSHIYLLDEKGENLVLTAGAGEPGRMMVSEGRSIPLDREQSLVARAARERKGVTVNDVTQAPDFLPNPLLPDTRSELAVPMIVGDKVIGVFDIQSEQVGRFTDSDVNIQTTLAAQVAVSIQNVRSFEQAKRQAEIESLANAIGQKIQRSSSVEDTLQIAVRELGMAIGAARVKVNIEAGHKS
jgi:putative methionine-R-sulfoxide reductase with GAF domain